MRFLIVSVFFLMLSSPVLAMSPEGCGAGECRDCHSMNLQEASALLGQAVDRVVAVDFSEVPGLWVVETEKGGRKFPLYIDFSKQYLVAGNIVRLTDNQNITQNRLVDLNRVDTKAIPTGDALLLGRKEAKRKVIVFTDPECPYCRKLHDEMKDVVARDPDTAFLIKMFPLKMHPKAHDIAKTILCTRSIEHLNDAFAGKAVPPPLCNTDAVEKSLADGEAVGVRSTPTIILPDGRVIPGFKKADDILRLVGSPLAPPPEEE
ncbi:MAG: protein-disulfide isomerase [Desulfuromonas sp.]|nr:MAG: protein-disulfide isomerase [Desulfuromonas sp.]